MPADPQTDDAQVCRIPYQPVAPPHWPCQLSLGLTCPNALPRRSWPAYESCEYTPYKAIDSYKPFCLGHFGNSANHLHVLPLRMTQA